MYELMFIVVPVVVCMKFSMVKVWRSFWCKYSKVLEINQRYAKMIDGDLQQYVVLLVAASDGRGGAIDILSFKGYVSADIVKGAITDRDHRDGSFGEITNFKDAVKSHLSAKLEEVLDTLHFLGGDYNDLGDIRQCDWRVWARAAQTLMDGRTGFAGIDARLREIEGTFETNDDEK